MKRSSAGIAAGSFECVRWCSKAGFQGTRSSGDVRIPSATAAASVSIYTLCAITWASSWTEETPRTELNDTMTRTELLREVLQGVLLIVGEYRGSHAEMAGYVDKKFGNKIEYVRAIHVVECSWHGHLDRVIITERFPETFSTAV